MINLFATLQYKTIFSNIQYILHIRNLLAKGATTRVGTHDKSAIYITVADVISLKLKM